MATEQLPTPTTNIFTGWRDLGRAGPEPAQRNRAIGDVVFRFIQRNRPPDEFLGEEEIFAIGDQNREYNQQAYKFFGHLYQCIRLWAD